MIVKKEIKTRSDFMGQIAPTENTDLLLNFKQTKLDWSREVETKAQERNEFLAEGFPRAFLDGIDDDLMLLKTEINGDDHTQNDGIVFVIDDVDILEDTVKIADLKYGYYSSNSSIPSDGGAIRSLSIFFKLDPYDVTGTRSIFSQRVTSNKGYHIGLIDSELYMRAYNSSGTMIFNTYIGSEALVPNTWYNLIIVHSDISCQAYLNGVWKLDFTITNGSTINYNNPYVLGAMLSGSYRFKGRVKSLWIISDNISSTEALAFQNTYYNNFKSIPNSSNISTSGDWNNDFDLTKYDNSYALYSNDEDDTFELSYFGNEIDVYLRQYADGGKANIYIDDELIEEVDTLGVSDEVIKIGTYTNNIKTNHTLKIEVSDIPAVGDGIYIDYFVIKDVSYYVNPNGLESLHPDEPITTLAKMYSYPEGLPRLELDGLDETDILFYRKLNSLDADLALTGGATYFETDKLFDNNIKVLDLTNDGYGYTSNIPTNDGGTNRTIVVWFKPTTADIDGNYGSIASQRASTNKGYHIGINAINMLYIRIYSSTAGLLVNYDPMTGTPLVANKWYCAILSHDNTTYQLYLNNTLMDNGTYSGTIGYDSNPFKFGVALATNSWQFHGYVATMFIKSDYWTPFDVADYLEKVQTMEKLMTPSTSRIEYTGDWVWEQPYASSLMAKKAMVSSNINEEFTFTFKGKSFTLKAFKDIDGGSFDYYSDGYYQGTFDLYRTTLYYGSILTTNFNNYDEHTIRLVNTSGNSIKIGEFITDAEENIIFDESGKNNDATLYNYSAVDRDLVELGLHEFALLFDRDDLTDGRYLYLPDSIYDNIGDKFLLGAIVKPSATPTSGVVSFHLFSDYNGANNSLAELTYYQSFTASTDYLGLYGDYGGANVDIGGHLDDDHWYFMGAIVDDIEEKITFVCYDLTDNTTILEGIVAYTGTNYSRTNFNQAIINYIESSDYGSITLDSFIFEGDTDHDLDSLYTLLHQIEPCKGGDLNTPNDILAVYDLDGKLSLRQESLNYYVASGNYESKVFDLGGLFIGSGKLNISKSVPIGTTITNIQTRTTTDINDDSPTWSSWEDISDIGIIASPNRQYIQVRFDMSASSDLKNSPSISNFQFLDIDPVAFERKAFSYPIKYDINGNKVKTIGDCTNLHQIIENNGANFLTFDIPYDSNNIEYLTAESQIRLYDETYIIKRIEDIRTDKTIKRIYAEALFYYLAKQPPLKEKDFTSVQPIEVLNYILNGTGWEMLICDITVTRDFSIDSLSNPLEQLRKVRDLWGGDLIFDNDRKNVSLLNNNSQDNGVLFSYKKNMEETKRIINSTKLANRVYIYGEDDLNISSVNDGLEYLENDISDYVPDGTVLCEVVTVGYFSDATELLSYGNFIKNNFSSPEITYECKAKDLEVLPNTGDISYTINDIVTAYDEQISLELKTRIVSVDYNILLPHLSTIVLATSIKSLGDDITEFKKHQQRLDRLNWVTMFRMFRQYLQDRIRGIGWISADYVSISGTPSIGSTGIISLQDPTSYLNVRAGDSTLKSIIGSKNHGDRIIVTGLTDGWYKIDL